MICHPFSCFKGLLCSPLSRKHKKARNSFVSEFLAFSVFSIWMHQTNQGYLIDKFAIERDSLSACFNDSIHHPVLI